LRRSYPTPCRRAQWIRHPHPWCLGQEQPLLNQLMDRAHGGSSGMTLFLDFTSKLGCDDHSMASSRLLENSMLLIGHVIERRREHSLRGLDFLIWRRLVIRSCIEIPAIRVRFRHASTLFSGRPATPKGKGREPFGGPTA